ncbi:hypothetical protein BJY52DRAFT_1197592 [Lactarius psammicola]|nr:hypothetical protein BJY52DRAFT_1197592 [Lactarius psammicola]
MLKTILRMDKMAALHQHLNDIGMLKGPGFPSELDDNPNDATNVPLDSEELEDEDEAVVSGKSQNVSEFDVQLVFRTQSGYPSQPHALAMYICQPKFPLVFAQFLYKVCHPDEQIAPSKIEECPAFDGVIKVHHSAVATFYVPGDLSGSGGMQRK